MPGEKLSLKTKIGFGICDLGGNLFFTIMGFFLLFFLTDTVGLGAGLAGTALMIGKFWDAVTDPMVGYVSDRTESKWGRRRPYMFIGALWLFYAMILMFMNPGITDQMILFIWAMLFYCILNTAYTLVNIPYGALTPELTTDFNERTVLNGYRMSFAVVGTLTGAGLMLPIMKAFPDPNIGWAMAGLFMGAVMAATALVTVFTVKEPARSHTAPQQGVWNTYFSVLKNKVFLLALIPWTLHITGVTIIQTALLYYFKYIYKNEGLFQIALLILLISSLVLIPIWVKISKRIGKKSAYNYGMLIFAAVIVMFFFLGEPLGPNFALAMMGLAGIGLATQYVMPYSLVPDVVEYDYAETGLRREGVYYGLWTFTSKIGQAFAIFLSGWMLALFGYIADVDQTATAVLGIKLLCGPVPAVFFIIGVVVLSFYPITLKFYEGIMEKIKQREAAEGKQ